MQHYSRPHFYYKPDDQKAEQFAKKLGEVTGVYDQENCDVIVTIPGDGSVYHAFHHAVNKPVFAVKPTTSNSVLFSGHENIENGLQLKEALTSAHTHTIHPLKTDIYMSDGTMTQVWSYVDINIRSDNAQATLIQEHINDIPSTDKPVMGSGWIVATPLGSTALNETRDGEVLPIGTPSIVRTMNGVSNYYERQMLKEKNMISVIIGDNSLFHIRVAANHEKRATVIDHDSWTFSPKDGTNIVNVRVTIDKAPERARILLLNTRYRTPNPFL